MNTIPEKKRKRYFQNKGLNGLRDDMVTNVHPAFKTEAQCE
jgi:hypothetical protein